MWIRSPRHWIRSRRRNCATSLTRLESRVNPTPAVLSAVRLDPNPNKLETVRFEVQFNEDVSGVDASDFQVSGSGSAGSLVASVEGKGSLYTVAIATASTANGFVSLRLVDDDSIIGDMGIPLWGVGVGSSQQIGTPYSVDRVRPTVAVASLHPPTVLGAFPVTVTFSEPVTGFDLADLTVSNGLISNLAGGGQNYSLVVTPIDRGEVSLSVRADSAIDAVGNSNATGSVLLRDHRYATGEFIATGTTVGLQWTGEGSRSIASDPEGNTLLVWQGTGPGDIDGIFGQRFDARGAKLGSEFRINTSTTKKQDSPSIAVSAAGSVVVWVNSEADWTSTQILAQRYDPAGKPLGGEFPVNSPTDFVTRPTVAIDNDGDVFVAWNFAGTGTVMRSVRGRRFDSSGVALGNEFDVSTNSTYVGENPSVAMDPVGNTVVVWAGGQSNGTGGIYGQRYDSAGAKVSGEFVIHNAAANQGAAPVVSVDAIGRFTVAWYGAGANGAGIYGQRFAATGSPQGTEFLVSTNFDYSRRRLSMSGNSAGEFAITWPGKYEQDGSREGVYARWFDSGGQSVGSEFQVNAFTTNSQSRSSVAMAETGDIVVVWTSSDQDGSGSGVTARRIESLRAGGSTPGVRRIQRLDPSPTKASTVRFAVEFSEPVTGVDLADFAIFDVGQSGNSIIGLAGSGSSYVVTLATGTGSGPLRLDLIDDDSIVNISGQPLGGPGAGSGSLTHGQEYDIDRIAPTVVLTSHDLNTTIQPFSVFVSHAEPILGLDLGDFVVSNGSASQLAYYAPGLFTVLITPIGTGLVTVAIQSGAFTDLAGNGNTPSPLFTREHFAATPIITVNPNVGGLSARAKRTVATDGWGRSLVVWQQYALYGQWFDATGAKVGSAFLIDSETYYPPRRASVTANELGEFAVVWEALRPADPDGGVLAKRLRFGEYFGPELLVNSATKGFQYEPVAGMDAAGQLIVVWTASDLPSGSLGVFGQMINSAGQKVGRQFHVNSTLTGQQQAPGVTMTPSGSFVVTWVTDSKDVVAQRFDALGHKLGGEIAVSAGIPWSQEASITSDGAGTFAIVWHSMANSKYRVHGRRFSADGLPVGADISVSSNTTAHQQYPSIAMNNSGDFVVTWESEDVWWRSLRISGQRFDRFGNLVGTEFRLSGGNSRDNHWYPNATMDADGDAFFVWEYLAQTQSPQTIQARRVSSSNPDLTPPTVDAFQVNDGSAQRSRVASIDVAFSERLALHPELFRVDRIGPGGQMQPVKFQLDLSASQATHSVARLVFSGPSLQFGSLVDGLYQVTVADNYVDFAGNAGALATYSFHRLFGDSDGNRIVDAVDLLALRGSFLGSDLTFDFDGNGQVDTFDTLQFRLRFLRSI